MNCKYTSVEGENESWFPLCCVFSAQLQCFNLYFYRRYMLVALPDHTLLLVLVLLGPYSISTLKWTELYDSCVAIAPVLPQ